jgi:hypothetical protein
MPLLFLWQKSIVEDVKFTYIMMDFCPCCGIQLRLKPSNREGKEILRKKKVGNVQMLNK